MMRYIAKSYPLQVFRHRVYLPWLSLLGYLGDMKRGIITQEIIELSDLGIKSSVGTRFETISYGRLRTNLMYAKNLGFDKFLDIGCGLGRSLVVADEVGFCELYGVDISDNLISRCRTNMMKVNAPCSLTCSDVDNFVIPREKLVIYLFNPFGEEKMSRLVTKLSCREEDTLIIYHNPKHFECFANLKKIKTHIWKHFGLYTEKTFIYFIEAKINS